MYHFLQMGSRHAIVAFLLSGRGRLGFDAIRLDDATPPGTAISLDLPGGGSIRKLTSGPDGAWYALSDRAQGYRSDDGQSWVPCGARTKQDDFNAEGVAFVGTRMYVGSNTRLLRADPPWTTWTAQAIGGGNRAVYRILPLGTELWLSTSNGIFVSNDQAMSFTRVSSIMYGGIGVNLRRTTLP